MNNLESSNKIILIDDNDNEQEYTIFFTYTDEETDRKYVFYYDDSEVEDDTEDPVYYVSRFDDEGNIYELDAQEQDMAEEVFNTFFEENEYEIDN